MRKVVYCFGCGRKTRRARRGYKSVGTCWRKKCRRAYRRNERENKAAGV